jgi:hypothetical protein
VGLQDALDSSSDYQCLGGKCLPGVLGSVRAEGPFDKCGIIHYSKNFFCVRMTVLADAAAGQENHYVNEGPCGPQVSVIKTVLKMTPAAPL